MKHNEEMEEKQTRCHLMCLRTMWKKSDIPCAYKFTAMTQTLVMIITILIKCIW